MKVTRTDVESAEVDPAIPFPDPFPGDGYRVDFTLLGALMRKYEPRQEFIQESFEKGSLRTGHGS